MLQFKKQTPEYKRRRKYTRYSFRLGKKFKIEWIADLRYWKIEFNHWAE